MNSQFLVVITFYWNIPGIFHIAIVMQFFCNFPYSNNLQKNVMLKNRTPLKRKKKNLDVFGIFHIKKNKILVVMDLVRNIPCYAFSYSMEYSGIFHIPKIKKKCCDVGA